MAFEFLFSSIPALPDDPGGGVDLTPARFAAMCADEGGDAAELTRALLMVFDLKAMERIEFGADPSETAVLSEAQLRDRTYLPEWLAKALSEDGSSRAYPFDTVWEAYYRELKDLAARKRSRFLSGWISWDVGLRNSISRFRASRAGEENDALVIEGLSEENRADYRPIMDNLINLMDGSFDSWREMDRTLNQLRIGKARELGPTYTFNMDELLSYTTQYVIMRGSSYLSN